MAVVDFRWLDLVRIELTWFSVCKTDDHAMQSRSPKRDLFMCRWSRQPPAFKVRKPSTHSQGGWCWRKDSNLQINDPKSFVYANSTTPANKEFYNPHREDSNFVSRWTRTNFYSFGFPEPNTRLPLPQFIFDWSIATRIVTNYLV